VDALSLEYSVVITRSLNIGLEFSTRKCETGEYGCVNVCNVMRNVVLFWMALMPRNLWQTMIIFASINNIMRK